MSTVVITIAQYAELRRCRIAAFTSIGNAAHVFISSVDVYIGDGSQALSIQLGKDSQSLPVREHGHID